MRNLIGLAILSPRTRVLIEDMRLEWSELDRRIGALTAEFVSRAREDQAARRLATIPGVGLPSARARPSAEPGISPRGWGSCHGRRQPGASLVSSASPSEATPTCERS